MDESAMDEPIAAALTKLVLAELGKREADGMLLDAILMGLCLSLPPLAPKIDECLQGLEKDADALELEAGSQGAFNSRIKSHRSKLVALMLAQRTG